MIGILCEKPSAGRNFAKALGGTKGTYNGEQYVITCARGHLYSFAPPEEQVSKALAPKYKSWDLANLPWDEREMKWKYVKANDSASTLNDIKSTLSTCTEIIIATDDDPTGEGELLAWEILDNLKLSPKKWSRMYFADESEKEIQKAFKNRKTIPSKDKDGDYIKALYRAKWDYMSMQFTRVAKLCGDAKSTLRQGRLKSAMVLLVGDQLKKVSEYKKIPFYQNKFKDENGVIYSDPNEPMFPKKEDVPNKYSTSDVVVDSKSMKATAPPKMLDLAALSARLVSKGYKAKQITTVYQKMYEAQIVSYPRTEDKVISPEQFNDLLPLVDKIAAVVGVDPSILTHRTPRSTHVKTGQAHGANRPGTNVPASLASLASYGPCAADIYKLLATNYLATLAEDYEYESQKGHLKDYPTFKGTASVPKKMGWKAIYSDDSVSEDENNKGLGTKADPFVHEGFPPKPTAPTMKWLMTQLEKRDVGTGATRTSTYAEVTSDNPKSYPLMKDSRGKITFTTCGEMSYHMLPGTNIGSLDITEALMADMRAIAKGEKDPDVCLRDVQRMVKEDIITMKSNGEKMRKELGITMASADKYEGIWNGDKVSFKKVWSGHEFTDDECESLCNGDEIIIEAVSSKTGKTFKCKGILAKQEFNGREYVGFKNTGFVNNDSVPDEWCKHKFTSDEKSLLESGMSIECDDFVSKKGSTFKAKIHYGKNDKGYMGIIPEFS